MKTRRQGRRRKVTELATGAEVKETGASGRSVRGRIVEPSRAELQTVGHQTFHPPPEGTKPKPSHWVTRLETTKAAADDSAVAMSPVIDSISLGTLQDMEAVERIQASYEFTRNLKAGTLDRGWLLSMPSLYELQSSVECERHFWVAKAASEVIGYFAISAPLTMSRTLSKHKFFGEVPEALFRAFTTEKCLYVSQVAVDPSPEFRRKGVIASMLQAVLSSEIYPDYPALAHIAIDPPNPASEAFFRKQGFELIAYTSNAVDPRFNTGLPPADSPEKAVIGGLWIKPPAGVRVASFDGPAKDAVEAHPVADGENFNRFMLPRTAPDPALQTMGDFLEYGSMLRAARSNARRMRDALATQPIAPGHVIFAREPHASS